MFTFHRTVRTGVVDRPIYPRDYSANYGLNKHIPQTRPNRYKIDKLNAGAPLGLLIGLWKPCSLHLFVLVQDMFNLI